jgi:GH15 family glucan-1,4-alpha-glucosidase
MCWAAVDRGLRLAEDCLRQAPMKRWRRARDEFRESVDEHGYDHERETFVQAYGSGELDAALLLLPSVVFIAYDDPRMMTTTDAISDELDDHGLLRRYRADDGLGGEEGVFVACTFWLAECLARQHRIAPAQVAYDRATNTANDLGLYAEEYEPQRRELLGNFPQGLSHLSHIAAAVALAKGAGEPS